MNEEFQRLFLTTNNGDWKGFEEIAHLELGDIPIERIARLVELLVPAERFAQGEDSEIPLTAARLLCSWGNEAGLEYLETLIAEPQRWSRSAPHRLRGYDTTYELILSAILLYWARQEDKGHSAGEQARMRIAPDVKQIVKLANVMPFELSSLYSTLEHEKWPEYLGDIKLHLESILREPDKHHWKIADALSYLEKVDPEYVAEIRRKHKL